MLLVGGKACRLRFCFRDDWCCSDRVRSVRGENWLSQRPAARSGAPLHRKRSQFLQVPAAAHVQAPAVQDLSDEGLASVRRLRGPRYFVRAAVRQRGKRLSAFIVHPRMLTRDLFAVANLTVV